MSDAFASKDALNKLSDEIRGEVEFNRRNLAEKMETIEQARSELRLLAQSSEVCWSHEQSRCTDMDYYDTGVELQDRGF